MNRLEVVVEIDDDFLELFVFGAGIEFGSERHEKGNLKRNLVTIGTIKDTVKTSIGKGCIEIF